MSSSAWKALLVLPLVACFPDKNGENTTKVINGEATRAFPAVVLLRLDGKGTCTGTFVSDSLLITAAHCVDKIQQLAVGDVNVERENFFIHPDWPSENNCDSPRIVKNDVALVRFPDKTYTDPESVSLRAKRPSVGEKLTIVGFGHNLIEPFEKYCQLQREPQDDGSCVLRIGTRERDGSYSYTDTISFKPSRGEVGCPRCEKAGARSALAAENQSLADIIERQCEGNFRDRPYRESGVGTKRRGVNQIAQVDDGVIRFTGNLGGINNGVDSVSGAGDSGGPLFINEGDSYLLSGVTHGGYLSRSGAGKTSEYADLTAPHIRQWLQSIVQQEKLVFPDIQAEINRR